jgi:hypothetical protein
VIGTPKKLPSPTITTKITETTEVVVTEDIANPKVKETAVIEKVETVTTVERASSPSKLLVGEGEEESIVSETMPNPFTEDASPKKKVSANISKKSTNAKAVSKKGNKRELVVEAEEETVVVSSKRRGPTASARKAPSDLLEEAVNEEAATTPPNKRVKRNL